MRSNKTVWIVGGVLVVVFIIGAVVASGGKKSKTAKSPPVSARALVVSANRPRTVVVPPCNTPVGSTVRNAARGRPTPGATTVLLPRGRGFRTVLVPNCQPTKSGSTNAEGGIPSAAFVLGSGKRLSKDKKGRIEDGGVVATSQLLLPDGSNTPTIVVQACTKKPADNERDVVLNARGGNSDVAVAPAC